MSGDIFLKVMPGQPLSIPAAAWNTLMDMARAWHANNKTFGNASNRETGSASKILIKNSSGSNVGRFGILGIDGVVLDPTTAPDEFKNRVIFDGNTPSTASHVNGKFAITAEPINNGEYGYAYSSGVCHCQINIIDENHAFADIADSDLAKLESSDSGSAVILYKQSGTGTKWAIVRIGGSGGGSSLAIYTAIVVETPNTVDEPKYYLCRIKDDSILSWAGGTAYVVGDVREYDDKTWTCLVNHTSTIVNRPPNAAFWSEETPINVYPKGSFNNSSYNVTECEPQFVQGDEIPVYQIDSVWYADITILYVGANGSRKWDTSEKRVMSVYR